MRYRSPELVVDEIEILGKDFGVHRIGFRDEIFASSRRQTEEICKQILDRDLKISWLANPRNNYLNEKWLSDDMMDLMVRSGANKLSCGAESGSQRMQDFLKKGCKVEDTISFVKRTTKYGIVPVVAYMTGLPTETEADRQATISQIREIWKINPDAYINGPALFRPYPGGDLFKHCIDNYDLQMPKTLEDWAGVEALGGHRPPWVKRFWFDQYIWTSTRGARATKEYIMMKIKENPIRGIAIAVFCFISKIRMKNLFYKYPIELWALAKWNSILGKVPKFS
jgi:radical SAM superfamily enzyme YgiQ (UPF0313 family)